jgi:hypothetical protein
MKKQEPLRQCDMQYELDYGCEKKFGKHQKKRKKGKYAIEFKRNPNYPFLFNLFKDEGWRVHKNYETKKGRADAFKAIKKKQSNFSKRGSYNYHDRFYFRIAEDLNEPVKL